MSLYNMLFGTHPLADILLRMLGLTRSDTGRFRDCYINDQGNIAVYTRNGGGNREDYQEVFNTLAKHPQYLENSDDDFNSTYATITFRVPEEYSEQVKALSENRTLPPSEKWEKLLASLKENR